MGNDKRFKNSIAYPVMVSNDYILAKHDLSSTSQDVVILIASKIQQNEFTKNLTNDGIIKLDAEKTRKALNTEHRNIKRILTRLREETVNIPIEFNSNGMPIRFRSTGLVLRFDFDPKGEKSYDIEIDEKMLPHFQALGKYAQEIKYTIANEQEHYNLTFKHSKRLYMIFRKIQFQNVWRVIYKVEELNKIFDTNYKRYADLKRKVLDDCVAEINEKTKIKALFEPRKSKESRAYDEVVFDLEFADVDKNLPKYSKEDEKLKTILQHKDEQ